MRQQYITGEHDENAPCLKLAGRKIIVSGGASGMGASAVRAIADAGAEVCILDVQADLGASLAAEVSQVGRAHFLRTDVSRSDQVASSVETASELMGGIDGLFHHAGILVVRPYHETSDDEWDRLMRINVDGSFFVTRQVIPHLIRAGGGDLVVTASISSGRAFPLESGYCISKAAVLHLARCIAVEYRDQGIRCNAICPAFTRTPHGTTEIEQLSALGQSWGEEGLTEKQGRICEPEEVAQTVLFLLDRSKSGFINGQDIYLDNGWMAAG